MKHKEITIGQDYRLVSSRYSNPAESENCFKQLMNQKVQVIEKYNDTRSKNTIRIEAITDNSIIEIWCSPYDLEKL